MTTTLNIFAKLGLMTLIIYRHTSTDPKREKFRSVICKNISKVFGNQKHEERFEVIHTSHLRPETLQVARRNRECDLRTEIIGDLQACRSSHHWHSLFLSPLHWHHSPGNALTSPNHVTPPACSANDSKLKQLERFLSNVRIFIPPTALL